MNPTIPAPSRRRRIVAAVLIWLANLAVVTVGLAATAALIYDGHLLLAAVASVGTFGAYYVAQRYAFDALDRLRPVEPAGPAADLAITTAPAPARPDMRTAVQVDAMYAAQLARPSQLVGAAQAPGRHRPETLAGTYAMPAAR